MQKSLEQQIEETKDKISVLDSEIEPLQKRRSRQYTRLEKLQEQYDAEKVKSLSTFEDKIAYFIEFDYRESTVKYKATQAFFEEYMLRADGYVPASMQVGLRISIDRDFDDSTMLQLAENIEKVLPYMKPAKDENKVFSIFEHNLSASGAYELYCNDNKFSIIKHYYSRTNVEKSFDNLKDALYYIRERHYYE